jgi:hypothetical protein
MIHFETNKVRVGLPKQVYTYSGVSTVRCTEITQLSAFRDITGSYKCSKRMQAVS